MTAVVVVHPPWFFHTFVLENRTCFRLNECDTWNKCDTIVVNLPLLPVGPISLSLRPAVRCIETDLKDGTSLWRWSLVKHRIPCVALWPCGTLSVPRGYGRDDTLRTIYTTILRSMPWYAFTSNLYYSREMLGQIVRTLQDFLQR
jgi:hypothetical protein